MDNEIDIWGSTHRDVHPNPSAYNEMRDTYVAEAGALKGWDPNAIRLGRSAVAGGSIGMAPTTTTKAPTPETISCPGG
jgi:hypothetical protein